ncbi:dihydroxyacetone kinase subunit DhaL [Dermacoccaceae bacterium W4C1]
MTGCDAAQVSSAVLAMNEVVAEHREELTTLDRHIGDGDHGENLARGFAAVEEALQAETPDTPGAVLKLVARTLISKVGGASGPLFGTAFLRAATSLGDQTEVDGAAVAQALRAAVDGVVARGKAEVGDKTVLDALEPAARAAEDTAAASADATAGQVLAAAAGAAESGSEATLDLVARRGRASYLGERSAGHIDPGSRSAAYLLRSLANSAAST